MKTILIIGFVMACSLVSSATTLEECKELARTNSPLIKQVYVNKEISSREIDNAWTAYYPQLSIDAQATYQSDVLALPISFPGINIQSPNNDQYQASLNVNQLIWDGGASKNTVDIKKAMLELTNASLEAKLFKLNEIINGLYFNVLIVDKSMEMLRTAISTLDANLVQVNSLVENGVLLPSNRKSLELEKTKMLSQIRALEIDRKTAVEQLEYWIGTNIDSDNMQVPASIIPQRLENNRPEIALFDVNVKVNKEYEDLAHVAVMPKIALFAKFGYGKPNQFNMFENEWTSNYIAGIKFQWAPFDWFNSHRNAEIAQLKTKNVEYERADFLQNIEVAAIRDRNEIEKLTGLIADDLIISQGHKQIANEKFIQLTGGVITASEYLLEYNRFVQSEISLSINQLKIELNKLNLLNKYGN